MIDVVRQENVWFPRSPFYCFSEESLCAAQNPRLLQSFLVNAKPEYLRLWPNELAKDRTLRVSSLSPPINRESVQHRYGKKRPARLVLEAVWCSACTCSHVVNICLAKQDLCRH
ncbi:hypothetical protein BC937DRAFT_90156 [Endogone sp. FLAS-F59071]|nr:hypothetical protein BC937DRAFT_90156 [Endogone sp. FLAS-F59071]|eukprot:RUS17296.1 hypothetical protein BC937DRAFT_90156 [Endogone sp. FLAS-F59071]